MITISIFDFLNNAFNSLSDFISVDAAFLFNLLVAPPYIAIQHFVIAPIAELFANLF